jgi:hypothetical protein
MGISRILRRGGGPGHCIFRLTFAGVFNIFSMASQTLNRCRENIFRLIPGPWHLFKGASAADGMLSGPPAAQFFTQPRTGKTVQKERP